MDIKKSFPDKKRKIIRYLGIALIIIGLAIIIYPIYTNLILARREADILTSWNVELASLQDTNDNKEIEFFSQSAIRVMKNTFVSISIVKGKIFQNFVLQKPAKHMYFL